MNGGKPTITIEEAAAALQVHRRTVSRMIKRGELPGVLRATKPIRISRAAFERWLEGKRTKRTWTSCADHASFDGESTLALGARSRSRVS